MISLAVPSCLHGSYDFILTALNHWVYYMLPFYAVFMVVRAAKGKKSTLRQYDPSVKKLRIACGFFFYALMRDKKETVYKNIRVTDNTGTL